MNLVSDLMIKDPVPCTPTTRLEEIERLMHEQHCTEISIVDTLLENRLVGLITDEDIMAREKIEGVDLSLLNAEQCMTNIPFAVTPSTSLVDCLHLMDVHHIERMPVVDESGHYCGVINKITIINSGFPSDSYA